MSKDFKIFHGRGLTSNRLNLSTSLPTLRVISDALSLAVGGPWICPQNQLGIVWKIRYESPGLSVRVSQSQSESVRVSWLSVKIVPRLYWYLRFCWVEWIEITFGVLMSVVVWSQTSGRRAHGSFLQPAETVGRLFASSCMPCSCFTHLSAFQSFKTYKHYIAGLKKQFENYSSERYYDDNLGCCCQLHAVSQGSSYGTLTI